MNLLTSAALIALVSVPSMAAAQQAAPAGVEIGSGVLPKVLLKVSQETDPVDPNDFKDNLGNHQATKDLNMGGFDIGNVNDINAGNLYGYSGKIDNLEANIVSTPSLNMMNGRISKLGDPSGQQDAVNYRTLLSEVGKAGDNMGNHIAGKQLLMDGKSIRTGVITGTDGSGNPIIGSGLTIGGQKITGLASPTAGADAATKDYVDTAASGAADNLGDHKATQNLNLNGFKIVNLPDPDGPTQATHKSYVDSRYTVDDGMKMTGAKVISVDNTVVRTDGDQNIKGVKNFNGTVNVNGWASLFLNSSAANPSGVLEIGPNVLRTHTDTNLSLRAGYIDADTSRVTMYFTAKGTAGAGTSYNSPALQVMMKHNSAITGNSQYGNGVDAADGGSGVIMTMGYRSIDFFRQLRVNGGLHVLSAAANRVARFDIPVVGYGGMTMNPGPDGEIRFNDGIFAHKFTTFSDRRLKKNIAPITLDDAGTIIDRIEPVSYDIKDDGRHALGVIAQDIKEIMPWAVSEAKDGMLSVEYTQIIPPLVAVVKDLRRENAELEARLDRLEDLLKK